MPKINANIQFMFNEYELLDRYDAAARAGFEGVEIQAPYSEPIEAIQERLERNGLKHVIINLPVADPETGQNNLPLLPDKVGIYQERVALGVEYAAGLGCIGVNTGIGPIPEGADTEIAYKTYVDNLRYAATELEKIGVLALVEPINTKDQPGFLLHTSSQGIQRDFRCWSPEREVAIRLLPHADHGRRLSRYLCGVVAKSSDMFNSPTRRAVTSRERARSTIPFIFRKLDELGYEGWAGAEYNPSGRTEDSLDWFKAL